MPFLCPECSTKSLSISSKIELRSDSRSDEIALQIVECSRCSFAAIAVYQESRRGALDSESVDHTGYRVSTDDLEALRTTIKRCPKPTNPRCGCAAHRKLGRKDGSGRWDGLRDVECKVAFALRL